MKTAYWAQIYESYQESKGATKKTKCKSKRFLKIFPQCPDCTKPLVETLHSLVADVDGYHAPNGFACIYSLPGCGIQKHHIDYTQFVGTDRADWPEYLPFVVIVALQENVSLIIEDKQVAIPLYSALIMRADVVHQGNNFRNCSGIRLHFYIDFADYVASHGQYNGFISSRRWRRDNYQKQLIYPTLRRRRMKTRTIINLKKIKTPAVVKVHENNLYEAPSNLHIQQADSRSTRPLGQSGLFSSVNIAKGTVIAVFNDKVKLSDSALEKLMSDPKRESEKHHLLFLKQNVTLHCYAARQSGNCKASLANSKFSCIDGKTGKKAVANCKIVRAVLNGRFCAYLRSTKMIHASEEIVVSTYGQQFSAKQGRVNNYLFQTTKKSKKSKSSRIVSVVVGGRKVDLKTKNNNDANFDY